MILDSIFNGDFSIEEFSRPQNSEYQELCSEISNIIDGIEKQDTQHTEIVKNLLSKIYESHYIETCQIFKIGFAAGLTLQQEAYNLLKGIHIDA